MADHTIDLKNADIVRPGDKVIVQISDPAIPMEIVNDMQTVLATVLGAGNVLVVVGDAMTVLIQRQAYNHDVPAAFTLLQRDGETLVGEYSPPD